MAFKTLSRWYGNLFNGRVERRLRSNDHQLLSGSHLLITFVGRQTGKSYTIPVNYARSPEGKIIIGTEANWWRNLAGGAEVELVVAGDILKGTAKPILDDEENRERSGRLISGPAWSLLSKSLVVIEISID